MGLAKGHEALKRTRSRGTETPPHLATLAYLRRLEREMEEVREALDIAWQTVEDKDARKCSRHMDSAQQRLHRVIKALIRKSARRLIRAGALKHTAKRTVPVK